MLEVARPSKADIHFGQVVYSKATLIIYDWLVTYFSNRFAWGCPRAVLLKHLQQNVSLNHLDIGVGTGHFLKKLPLSPGQQRLGLLDLNQNCLAYAAKQLQVLQPEIYQHDVFAPFTSIINKFDSVSLNYVLHCLPGNLAQKAIAFDHIKTVLNPGGTLFGSTLLGSGVKRNWLAERLTLLYNKKKIFCNLNDNYVDLQRELSNRFTSVEIKIQGCVALFVAKNNA